MPRPSRLLMKFLTANHNAWTLADRRERLKNLATLFVVGGAFLCDLIYLVAVLGDLL